jgi:hypothetical protein
MKDEGTSKLPGGRTAIYTYQHRRSRASATAQVEGTDILHVRENLARRMSRGQVETLFRADLDGKP